MVHPKPSLPPSQILTFDEDNVPCDSTRLRECYYSIELSAARAAEHGYESYATAVLAGAPADRTDGKAAHRYLIAQSKAARRTYGPGRAALRSALESARRHSRLYSRRTCECLQAAFAEFLSQLEDLLGSLPGGRGDVWAVTGLRGGAYEDRDAPLTPRVLVNSHDRYPLTLSDLGLSGYARMEVRVVDGGSRLEVCRGKGPSRIPQVWRRLEGARARVAASLRYAVPAPAAAVAEWPDGLAEIVLGLSKGRNMFATVTSLLAAGAVSLHPAEAHAAAVLAPTWPGSGPALLLAAKAIAAPVPAIATARDPCHQSNNHAPLPSSPQNPCSQVQT